MPAPETVAVIAIFVVASLTRATFGFGEALVAMPLLSFVVPLQTATPLVALHAMVMSLVVVVQDWRHIHVRSVSRLLIATIAGAPLGLWWLTSIDDRAVKLFLAVLIIVFSTFALIQSRLQPQVATSEQPIDRDRGAYAFGFLSGLLGSAYNTYGPPLVMYATLRGWNPLQFRATLQGYFFAVGLIILPLHASAGLWTAEVWRYFLCAAPALVVTMPLGRALNRRFSGAVFLKAVHVGLLLIAASLIVHLLMDQGGAS